MLPSLCLDELPKRPLPGHLWQPRARVKPPSTLAATSSTTCTTAADTAHSIRYLSTPAWLPQSPSTCETCLAQTSSPTTTPSTCSPSFLSGLLHANHSMAATTPALLSSVVLASYKAPSPAASIIYKAGLHVYKIKGAAWYEMIFF
jgi:hypothetical protein